MKIVSLTIIIISLLCFAFIFWNKNRVNVKKSHVYALITEKQARQIAEKNLNLFESWKDPYLTESYTAHDLNAVPTAYLFSVIDIYGKAGYLTISASTRLKPILDVSTDQNTPIVNSLSVRNNLIKSTNYNQGDVKMTIVYLGGTDYYGKFSFREGQTITERYFLLNSQDSTEIELNILEEKTAYYLETEIENVADFWKEYDIR